MNHNPVRYPGGKGRKSIVNQILAAYPYDYFKGRIWIEPFCGGCGLGLALLDREIIDRAVFNDADYRIAFMWQAMAYQTSRFIDDIEDIKIDMKTFRQAKHVIHDAKPEQYDDGFKYDIGFYTFILNRCCRSGYIDGGAIGGNQQSGKYKVDSRFNKEKLIDDIAHIGKLAADDKAMFVGPYDAIDLMKSLGEIAVIDADEDSKAFLYIDPPYIQKGSKCYRTRSDAQALCDYLKTEKLPWLVSYDDCMEVHELYDGHAMKPLHLSYTSNAQTIGKTTELLISNDGFGTMA